MKNKPIFSICLIARNESKTLPRLINSLKEFQQRGGEICVLDTGSTDGTADIAKSLGCIVEEVGNKYLHTIDKELAEKINSKFLVDNEAPVVKEGETYFDFASARNHAASLASNNMVSFADADECFTKLNIEKINELIASGITQFEYNFVYAHDAAGNEAVKFIQSKFYDRTLLKWKGIIHEYLDGAANRTFVDESILKLEHWQNQETNRTGYLRGLAIDCFNNPEYDRNSHYFARECLYTNRFKTAIKEFERHIAMNRWQTERAQSMLYIADCNLYLGDKDGATFWYLKSFDLEPNRREPLMKLAEMAFKENKPLQVIAYCVASLELAGVNFYATQQEYYTYKPHELLYWAYWQTSNKEKSKQHFDKAFAFYPTNPKFIIERQFFYNEEYKEVGIEGWMSLTELNWLYETSKKMNSVLELGSWKGRSTHALLSGCKGNVIAVDTFMGSEDKKDGTNGGDTYNEFMKNVGSFENLIIKQMKGNDASKDFSDKSIDMVFIDAEHTYDAVVSDIRFWKDKAKVVLCGHDYCASWPDVMRAVKDELGEVSVCDSIWYKFIEETTTNGLLETVTNNIKEEIQFTGERFIPGKTNHRPDIEKEHLARYNFAAQFTQGLKVLDAACGVGYAKEILKAKTYVGIDVSKEAIDFATQKYGFGFFRENLEDKITGEPVDVTISFETIEHLQNPHNFLSWVKENSKVFIFSIPVNMPSEFHKQVYSVDEIKKLINTYFKGVVYFNQVDDTINSLNENPKYIVGVATVEELPTVSIILPHLGREDGLQKCLNSIELLNYPKDLIDINVVHGDETVPEKVKDAIQYDDANYFCYAANDMTLEPNCLLIAIIQSILLNKGLVSFNEGPLLEDKGNICTHFIIKKQLIEKIGGEIFDTRFNHVGVDNLLWKKCLDINEAHYCAEAKIIHNHFSKGAEFDEVYKKGWDKVEEDRKILKELIN